MKIALISEIDINWKIAWSGTTRAMCKALSDAGADLDILDPIMETPTVTLSAVGKAVQKIGLSDPMMNRSRTVSRWKAAALQKRLVGTSYDALFAPVGSTLISEMPAGVPVIYSSDATLPLMEGYYGNNYGEANSAANSRAFAVEKSALNRADLLVYPTWWAAYSAMDDFGIDEDRILVQPFGANISDPPTRERALAPRKPGPLRLLFCAVEWERKGGDIALDAVRALKAAGVDIEFTILGVVPPGAALADPALSDVVTVVPFLDKKIPAERERFREIFLDADILILPTKAECYGMVFCEAAACGTISIATATGGVPEVIQDGETGYIMAPGSTGEEYAAAVLQLAQSEEHLLKMQHAARTDYETRLNWNVWGTTVLQRAEQMLARKAGIPWQPAETPQTAGMRAMNS